MKYRLLLVLIVTGLILFGTAPARGWQPSLARQRELLGSEINQVLDGDLIEVDVSRSRMVLQTRAGEKELEVASDAAVFRHGRPCSLRALRPAGEGNYHSVDVELDRAGRVVALHGYYRAAEVQILTVDPTAMTVTVTVDGTLAYTVSVLEPRLLGVAERILARDGWAVVLLNYLGQAVKIEG